MDRSMRGRGLRRAAAPGGLAAGLLLADLARCKVGSCELKLSEGASIRGKNRSEAGKGMRAALVVTRGRMERP